MKKHSPWMMLACIVPMLLIFILPAIGINGNALLLPLIILCGLSHFLMMGTGGGCHGGHHGHAHDARGSKGMGRVESHDLQHEATYTDPVCGMSTADAQAFQRYEYDGQTYYFCSDNCLKTFSENPARYIARR